MGSAETGAHVPLSPTLQGESPSAVNFSAPSRSSQPVPRQAIFCLIPGSRRTSQPLAQHTRAVGYACKKSQQLPPEAQQRCTLCNFSQCSVTSSHKDLAYLVPTTQFTSPAKMHSQGGNSQNCCRCSRHYQQGLKQKVLGRFCNRVLTTE